VSSPFFGRRCDYDGLMVRPSLEETTERLEEHLRVVGAMGDRDECSYKHIGYALAAIVRGNTWRDGVDYRDPAGANVFYIEWPAHHSRGFTVTAEELLHLVEFEEWDAAYHARIKILLDNPEYVAKGRQLIEDWKQKLAAEWEAVETIFGQVGREQFIEAVHSGSFGDCLDYGLE
jgi:hypothetical protein